MTVIETGGAGWIGSNFILHTQGWLPETKFADGIQKTIPWYLDNRKWWKTNLSGENQNYYEKMYGNR